MKQYFQNLKTKAPQAVAPTIVAALIFLITYFCFGAANSMIGPFATLSYLAFRNMKERFGCMARHFGIYLVMTFAAFAAGFNPVLCAAVNAAALFWIAYFLINEYQPTNYFPAGMALIFFQIAPVHTAASLVTRIAALAVSFGIILLFVWIPLKFRKKTEPLTDLVREGFSVCGQILDLCRNCGENPEELSAPSADRSAREASEKTAAGPTSLAPKIRRINHAIAMEIYSYNRAALQRRGRVNWFCRFLVFFQCFDFLTRDPSDSEALKTAGSLYNRFHHIFREETPAPDYKKLTLRYNRPDLRNFRFRFALRLVLVMTPCLTFCAVSGLENVYWLAISVFFMMIPFSGETKQRVRERVIGSMTGIVICFLLFTLFPGLPARIIIMCIANFFIYSAGSYASMVAYITCSALAIQTVDAFVPAALGERLLYTLIGAAIALLANRFLFPIRKKLQIEYLKEILFRIRHLLVSMQEDPAFDIFLSFGRRKKTAEPLDEACLMHQTDQLFIKSYLISKRIEDLDRSMPESERDPNLPRQEFEHMKFMAEYLTEQSGGSLHQEGPEPLRHAGQHLL